MASFGKLVSPLLRQLASTQVNQLRSVSLCSRLQYAEGTKPPAAPKKPVPSSQTKPPGYGVAYKVPEYYTHNPMTFYDIEKDMIKSRLPQPSSKSKKK